MKNSKVQAVVVTVLVLVAVGAAGYFAWRQFVLPREQECDVCGRGLQAGHASTILLKNGKELQACCPRCALHYEQHHPGELIGVVVADHATGGPLAAQRAVYVEGSDAMTCIPQSATPPREPGINYETVYDRCLPSLAAFRNEDEARRFAAVHGGRVLSYAQALESVREK